MKTPVVTVKMCGDPDCRLPGTCSNMPAMPVAGIAQPIDRAKVTEPILLRIFAQELTLGGCSDSDGVLRLIPPGSEFTVHHGITDPEGSGQDFYMAVYSGPASTRDEWLDGSPEWDGDTVQARWDEFVALMAAA